MANITCPKCYTTLEVPAELAGQNVACPNCQTTFAVPAAAPAPATPSSPLNLQQAGTMFNSGMTAASNYASNAYNKIQAMAAGQTVMSVIALIVAVVALIYSIFFVESIPRVKFSKDAKTACKNYLKAEWKFQALGDYNYDKNISLLSDIVVDEVDTNGDYAVVFYSIKKGASNYKATMALKKNKDGYYTRLISGLYLEKKKINEDWYDKVSDKISKYENGSVKLDTLFE